MAEHGHSHVHGHTHGPVDPSIISTGRGLWAVKLSFWGLMATALIQTVVILFSGSVALLADTIHNFADAASAIPLGLSLIHIFLSLLAKKELCVCELEGIVGLSQPLASAHLKKLKTLGALKERPAGKWVCLLYTSRCV